MAATLHIVPAPMLSFRFVAAFAAVLITAPAVVSAAGSATPADTRPAEAMVEYDATQQALQVSGPMGPRFEARVRAMLDSHPDVRRLIVRSPGGTRRQALHVARLVNARGISIRVAGQCASACALMWAAADAREMTADSRLGLHQSRLDGPLMFPEAMTQQINADNDRETDAVLRAAGFPEHVVARGSATPAASMSWFDAHELQREGVPFALHPPTSLAAPALATAQAADGSPAEASMQR
ncbi:hypothetical protein ACFFGH_14175 [Lysobacter korlensis]|uniref:ATP-dependent Clp protease proteolytic subunit n=1 Tax=Lysobacter korlensis TaxID=553636 RepID=A0ABV6RSW0_9GAMM